MKNLFALLFVLVSVSAFGQITQQTGGGGIGSSGSSTSSLSESQMGKSNGCRDGSRSLAQAQNAWISIMSNPAISNNYKSAYELGWGSCRGARAAGTIITSSGMTAESQCFNFGSGCSNVVYLGVANYFANGGTGGH